MCQKLTGLHEVHLFPFCCLSHFHYAGQWIATSIIFEFMFHQTFKCQLRKTQAVWTQLFPLWLTAVASMAPFMLTSWEMGSRPSTVPGVTPKCLLACHNSMDLKPFRYSLSLRPHHSLVGRCYHGNSPYGLSPKWVFWGSHGRRTTSSKVSSGEWVLLLFKCN